MSSCEITVVIFGSPENVAGVNLQIPLSTLYAFDVQSLENIVHSNCPAKEFSFERYFVVLLQSIDQDLSRRLKLNPRIVSISNPHLSSDQMTNSSRQLTLDLTSDIIHYLTSEGQKQLKLSEISSVKVCYQQARILKEWLMAFFKAEPCHILLISLNSTKQNLDSAQQRLQTICAEIGYPSSIIRQLSDYIPSSDRHSPLLPYCQLLFKNENPSYLCEMLKKLSGIRFYLYGNELSRLNNWSETMIGSERELMDDEDNWISFIQNEFVSNEVKWNFAFMLAKQWKISRVSPIHLNELNDNPRFQSALRRAHITFAQRQIEVTADIFDWYDKCVQDGFIQIQPKITYKERLLPQIRSIVYSPNGLRRRNETDRNEFSYPLRIRKMTYDTPNNPNRIEFGRRLEDVQSLVPLPMSIYDPDQPDLFLSYRRTIDSFLSMPHTEESRIEMIEEFRRIYSEDQLVLYEINSFEKNYRLSECLQW